MFSLLNRREALLDSSTSSHSLTTSQIQTDEMLQSFSHEVSNINSLIGMAEGPVLRREVKPAIDKLYSVGDRLKQIAQGICILEVHPDYVAKFDLPPKLILDSQNPKYPKLKEIDDQGKTVALSHSTTRNLKKIERYFTRKAQVEIGYASGKAFPMRFVFQGAHAANLRDREIELNLPLLLAESVVAASGVGKHEWGHAIADEIIPEYFSNTLLLFYFNAAAEKRINNFVRSLRDDFGLQMDAFEANRLSGNLSEKEIEQKNKMYLHEQFCFAIYEMSYGNGQKPVWLRNPDVIKAVDEAFPLLEPGFKAIPKSLNERDIQAAVAQFRTHLDRAKPIYEKLLPPSLEQIVQKLLEGISPGDLEAMQEAVKGNPSSETDVSLPEGLKAIKELAQKIMENRAGKLAEQFEPESPVLKKKRGEQIQQGSQGQPAVPGNSLDSTPSKAVPADQAKAEETKNPAKSLEPKNYPPRPVPPSASLSPEDKRQMELAAQKAIQDRVQGDLFRSSLPPRMAQAAERLRNILPPTEPEYFEGFYSSGSRMNRKAAIRDALSPAPTGRVMERRLGVGNYDAQILLVSDVSDSIVQAKAKQNTLIASASLYYLCEELGIDYGELVFQSHVKVIKPLGAKLGSYAAKNEKLNAKDKSFSDPQLGAGTAIKKSLDRAIDEIKDRSGETKMIVLITDGQDGAYHKTMSQLKAEAKKHEIKILVLAMGHAKQSIPHEFETEEYRFVADNGSDIPDQLLSLIEWAQKNRLGIRE